MRPGLLEVLTVAAALVVAPCLAHAQTAGSETPSAPQTWAIHGQTTFVEQANAGYSSPYRGPHSLPPKAEGRETWDATLYLGVRPWAGGELWINPEIDQGFGLGGTTGAAGFFSGEAYKVGKKTPYPKLPRLFLRQTFDLGGDQEKVEADQNQLAGSHAAQRLVITAGKFGVTDVFDTNQYAHDPRSDFFNWAAIDAGTFDYAANAWGFTYGAAAELYDKGWAVRGGVFDLSRTPNDTKLDRGFNQFQLIGEGEVDPTWFGKTAKLKVTAFLSRGRMGSFADAIALAARTGAPADITTVRHYQGRAGVSVNLEQPLSDDLGVFVRAGLADGTKEPYEFADIDRTVSGGLSLKGGRWGRGDDEVGAAAIVNQISGVHQRYFAAGGLGILIGDGQLPHPGDEHIAEVYYDWALAKPVHVTFDYQFVDNPGYNRDRGPISVGAIRLHGQF